MNKVKGGTMDNNELKHYGVLGMKWGVRRYRDGNGNYTADGKKRYIKDKTSASQRDIDSFKKIKNGVKDKKGRQILSKKEVEDTVAALEAVKRKRETKLSRKYDIAKTYQDINRNTSIGEKLVYNNATRKKAAKYVVDKNMTVSEASKKAKGDAARNTAIMVAAYGAITYTTLLNRMR